MDTYITHSPIETKEIGKKIAPTLHPGDIVLFDGELGAGKTTLIKGIAEYFNIGDVVSPTFTLMQLYEQTSQPGVQLAHIDTYRIEDEKELLNIGIDEYVGDKQTISLIEWPEKIPKILENKKVKKISLKHGEEDTRSITVT